MAPANTGLPLLSVAVTVTSKSMMLSTVVSLSG